MTSTETTRDRWAKVHINGDRNPPLPASFRAGPNRPFWKPADQEKVS